jgi:predicted small secreted protein
MISVVVTSHSLSTNRRTLKEYAMHKNIAIALVSLLVLSGAASMLSACNTTAGAGKDISATGRAITRSADVNR